MIKDKEIKDFIGDINIISDNKNELYSILIPLLLSRKVFKNSNEKREFIENVLGIKIANYAYKSKTILIGKVINEINSMEIEHAFKLNKKVNKFLLDLINANRILNREINKGIKKNKKNKKNSLFYNWSNYIKNMN
ncbi:hypothetical protein [Intestinibacter bartlettii]|jgi:hypothetical protein|uniref:hypothetical protein n=1 Tax=Intestinibacter bartlettii TaxID=261299 RepID=UPI0028FE7538|nr:hypothetical protein [Intestinibacter bartlettii]MDU2163296.1 hypothetical protein [Intestinibacter bartlettii]MDU4257566.1 hypothetical protein [Intestinibacter bartlettii]